MNRAYATLAGYVKGTASELASKRPLEIGQATSRLRALYVREGAFDWVAMGRDASVYFREPPAILSPYHM